MTPQPQGPVRQELQQAVLQKLSQQPLVPAVGQRVVWIQMSVSVMVEQEVVTVYSRNTMQLIPVMRAQDLILAPQQPMTPTPTATRVTNVRVQTDSV